ncbi:ABC transporter permease [Lactiplantibacillus pentosus]|uniref:ABC transporter permease n=1 Tax=Lactiplantibacillus pentosus TaxID=1589 RepID=UPI000EAA38E8|nr:ABC transporter permease [Lactiplantibacillus pentosus]AYG38482.1 ABC transporter permease [Lactiplantibacillus pentosus]AYG41142.1 ABC transporter permease [Lactiplantibacillus pentosus]MCJ8180828.1 ABC transporter permease [Lactiplantibacillus pentosus]MDC6397226.1 ABC transporter permease [Lactiplantibacillus pentosus]
MKTNLRIELYKFIHQKNGLWGLLVLPLLMIYSGQTTRLSSQLITFEFGAPQWMTLILIAVGSAFLSMEYRYRTIVPLVYKSTSKRAIYGAKLIVILGYGLLLTVVSALITMILKPIFTGDRYPWTPQLVQSVLINNASTLLYSFFLITLAFMLLMVIQVNAAVIGIGLIIVFWGASLSVAIIKTFSSLAGILKWNPFNMVFVTQQLSSPAYADLSLLTNSQLVLGTLVYSIIFLIIGYHQFKVRAI